MSEIKPWAIFLIGPTASGKSTLGSMFYNQLKNNLYNGARVKFYDGDSIRKKLKN